MGRATRTPLLRTATDFGPSGSFVRCRERNAWGVAAMLGKTMIGFLVASIALFLTTMFAPQFYLALLRLSKAPAVPTTEQTKAASRSRFAPIERPEIAPDTSKFDVARIDAGGASVFAGRAPPKAEVTVLANGEMVTMTKADENGQWATVVERLFAPGEYEFALRTRANGSTTQTISGNVRITIAASGQRPLAPSRLPKTTARGKGSDPLPPAPISFAYNE